MGQKRAGKVILVQDNLKDKILQALKIPGRNPFAGCLSLILQAPVAS